MSTVVMMDVKKAITEEIQKAVKELVQAERLSKIPDPKTGLVPCGCPNSDPIVRTHTKNHDILLEFSVVCRGCFIRTPKFNSRAEAITNYNTAMGYREETT